MSKQALRGEAAKIKDARTDQCSEINDFESIPTLDHRGRQLRQGFIRCSDRAKEALQGRIQAFVLLSCVYIVCQGCTANPQGGK